MNADLRLGDPDFGLLGTHPFRRWMEDMDHENGNYLCFCVGCGNKFVGHKRRQQCKLCADHPEVLEAYKALNCLALACPEDIAADVNKRVKAAFDALLDRAASNRTRVIDFAARVYKGTMSKELAFSAQEMLGHYGLTISSPLLPDRFPTPPPPRFIKEGSDKATDTPRN